MNHKDICFIPNVSTKFQGAKSWSKVLLDGVSSETEKQSVPDHSLLTAHYPRQCAAIKSPRIELVQTKHSRSDNAWQPNA